MGRLFNEKIGVFVASLTCALSIALVSNPPDFQAELQENSDAPELLYLDPYINGEKKEEIVAVVKKKDEIWLGQSEWQNLRINKTLSSDRVQEFFNESFVLVPGEFNPRIDVANLSLHLAVPVEFLPLSIVKSEMLSSVQTPSELGFFWNYLLFFSMNHFRKKPVSILITRRYYFSIWAAHQYVFGARWTK